MISDAQIEQTAAHILAAALQAATVEDGLSLIYDVIIAWAEQVSLEAVFAYNEARLDQQRLGEETRQKIPAREYLRFWSVAKLREEPVHALNQRLMEREYPPQRDPRPAGLPATQSEAEIAAYGQALASSLSIEPALDLFESLVVRYASLVDPAKVRQSSADEADTFRAVFMVLYYSLVDPISAHGLWQPVRKEGSAAPKSFPQRERRTPPHPYFEDDPPDVIFRQRLSPETLKAYQEAGRALIHYRIVHEHGMYDTVGFSLSLPQLSWLLNDFDKISLTGESDHWSQPAPRSSRSLLVNSLLLLAGTAAPAILLNVHIDPLIDTSATGQAVRRMLEERAYEAADSISWAMADTIILYQAAEKELKACWPAVERVANRLLEAGELSKAEVYRLFAGREGKA